MTYSETTWVTGVTPISAANLNNIEDGITAEQAARIAADAAVSQAAPVRVKTTIYQNTSGKPLLVSIGVGFSTGAGCTVRCDANSTPTTSVAIASQVGATSVGSTLTFIVPPSYYYRLYEEAATITVGTWAEWTLH